MNITTDSFLSQLQAEGFSVSLDDIFLLTSESPELFFSNWPDDGDAWTTDGMDAIREQLTTSMEGANQ